MNPDLEIGRFLERARRFANTPAGRRARSSTSADGGEPATLAILHGFVPQRGRRLAVHARRARAASSSAPLHRAHRARRRRRPTAARCSLLAASARRRPEAAARWSAPTSQSARLLGQRTAELHRALAARHDRPGVRARALHAATTSARSTSRAQPHRRARSQLLRAALPALRDGRARRGRAVLAAEGDAAGALRRRSLDRPLDGHAHPLPRRPPPRPGAASPAATS